MRLVYILAFCCICCFVFAYYEINQQISGVLVATLWLIFVGFLIALGFALIGDKNKIAND